MNQVSGLVVLEISSSEAQRRMLTRNQADRAHDDNLQVFAERVKYFNEHTKAVIQAFQQAASEKMLMVNAEQTPTKVATELASAIESLSTARPPVRLEL